MRRPGFFKLRCKTGVIALMVCAFAWPAAGAASAEALVASAESLPFVASSASGAFVAPPAAVLTIIAAAPVPAEAAVLAGSSSTVSPYSPASAATAESAGAAAARAAAQAGIEVLQAFDVPTDLLKTDLFPAASRPSASASELRAGDASAGPARPDPAATPTLLQKGAASWYGPRFHGRRTANGERYDQMALTAAHPTLPFGTIVRVKSLTNDREVEVRINDRGPYARGRVIDLSRAAAEAIGMLERGVKNVVLFGRDKR